MGYWETDPDGHSFSSGYEMLWGDSPADDIDNGLHRLIERITQDYGRPPTVTELDNLKFGTNGVKRAPEIVEAIKAAKKSFREGVGRSPTDDEIVAGLRFSDSALTLGDG
jgi:DNA-directed RNA polymerase specialized sigma subunit